LARSGAGRGAEGLTNGGRAPVHLAAYREHPPRARVRQAGRAAPGGAAAVVHHL